MFLYMFLMPFCSVVPLLRSLPGAYRKHLKDFKEAVKNYSKVLKNSKDGAHLITAEMRLKQLTKEGY